MIGCLLGGLCGGCLLFSWVCDEVLLFGCWFCLGLFVWVFGSLIVWGW